jgi:hypothetical protein
MNGHDDLFAHTESMLSRLGGIDPALVGSHARLDDALSTYRSRPRTSNRQQELIEALIEALEDDDDLRGALLETSDDSDPVVLKSGVRSWLVRPNEKFLLPTTSLAPGAKPAFGGSPLGGLIIKLPPTNITLPPTTIAARAKKPRKSKKPTTPAHESAKPAALASPDVSEAAARPRSQGQTTGAATEAIVSAVLEAYVKGAPAAGMPVEVVVDFGAPDVDSEDDEGEFSVTFPPGKNRLPMVVQLTSIDIDIDQDRQVQSLVMKRDGTSEKPAVFEIIPRKGGRAHLTATLLRMGSIVAQVSFAVDVSASSTGDDSESIALIPQSSIGRTMDALQIDSSRFLALSFIEVDGRFHCVVSGDAAMEAVLDISRSELEGAVLQLRDVLLGLSHDPAYQSSIHIDSKASDAALDKLARAGALLFHGLFYHRPNNPRAAAIGDLLVAQLGAAGPSRRIQFVVDGYGVPWHALYLAPALKGRPQWDLFLGLRHVIEELVVNLPRHAASIPVEKGLSVALHFDPRIDDEQDIPAVKNQRGFWTTAMGRASGITVKDRTKNSELMTSLGPRSKYQVIYFLCHAGAGSSSEGRPLPNASWLRLTEEPVTVGELTINAATNADSKLKQGPLVFVNACRSAELSTQYTVNFPNYFLDRGARTVVGTECEIATFFADVFARRLFAAILSGVPVGVALLDLRRAMIKDGNPLGLAYGLHGASDTYLTPALLTG